MYWPGAPRFLPTETEIPLLVDHNMERQVGVVHELFKLYWIDGGPWICARATVTDLPSASSATRRRRASDAGTPTAHRSVNLSA